MSTTIINTDPTNLTVIQRAWRMEALRESGKANRIRVHSERESTVDGELRGHTRTDIPAEAGAAVGDPTDPSNYPDSDGGMPQLVDMTVAAVAALPDTFTQGLHVGVTPMEVLQLLDQLLDAMIADRTEQRRVAVVNQAVADAS